MIYIFLITLMVGILIQGYLLSNKLEDTQIDYEKRILNTLLKKQNSGDISINECRNILRLLDCTHIILLENNVED